MRIIERHIAQRLLKREIVFSYYVACLDAISKSLDNLIIVKVVRDDYVIDK